MAHSSLTNPQTWNRYAYVTNNPLIFTDPSGLDEGDLCASTWDWGQGGFECAAHDVPRGSWETQISSIGWSIGWKGMTDLSGMISQGILPGENSTNFPAPPLLQTLWDVLGLPSLDTSNCMPMCDQNANPANNVQNVANYLKKCGGPYAQAGADLNWDIQNGRITWSSMPNNIFGKTAQDSNYDSHIELNTNVLKKASPQFFTAVVLHEWWHTQQQAKNPLFNFLNALNSGLPRWLGRGFLDRNATTVSEHIMHVFGAPTQ